MKLYAGFLLLSVLAQPVKATVVEFRTVMGDFQVNLFDETTPQTVQNFLDYVNSGAYANSIIHRSEPGFVVQGGGFTFSGDFPVDSITTGVPVINEPELSNLRGTIAMAKLSGQPDSATSQWFFNLGDNSANLDVQNSGFTVFGQVLDNGMDIVDAIAALDRFNLGGALASIPLQNFNPADDVAEENLVIITDVVVVDAAVVTNPNLNPAPNTLIDQPAPPPVQPPSNNGGSGGGSLSVWMFLLLSGFSVFRRLIN